MTCTKTRFKLISRFDGTCLSGICVAPLQPHGILQLAHGMAEHKERYLPFMEYMAERGFVCFLHDHRGHGGSVTTAGELGYFGRNGAEGVVRDLHQAVEYAKEQYPGLPLYLFGHSMGSLVVRCYLREFEETVNGLIVCGTPAPNPAAGPGIVLCKIIGRLKGDHYRSPLLRSMTTDPFDKPFAAEGLKNSWLSRDKSVAERYNADPLCGFAFTANGYLALMTLMRDAYGKMQAKNPRLPVHFLSGEKDPCHGGQFMKAVEIMGSRGWKEISSRLYPDMRHEVLNEIGKEQVWKDLADLLTSWLKMR